MYKNKIQVDWLNKLYEDIYYSDLEDSEHALDIITNLIADKEVNLQDEEDEKLEVLVIETTEELASIFENEGLMESYNFACKIIEQIQNGEFDEAFREDYFPDFYDLESDEEIPYEDIDMNDEDEDIDIDIIEEEEINIDDYYSE